MKYAGYLSWTKLLVFRRVFLAGLICSAVLLSGQATATTLQIFNINDLQSMQQNPAGSYVLMNDIDASATTTWDAGAGFLPIGLFTGTFDGNGYKITGLHISRSIYVGLHSCPKQPLG